MTKVYEIYNGSTRKTVIAKDVAEAVQLSGFAENTMLEVRQVCSFCAGRTKLYRNDCCLPCWNEMHD